MMHFCRPSPRAESNPCSHGQPLFLGTGWRPPGPPHKVMKPPPLPSQPHGRHRTPLRATATRQPPECAARRTLWVRGRFMTQRARRRGRPESQLYPDTPYEYYLYHPQCERVSRGDESWGGIFAQCRDGLLWRAKQRRPGSLLRAEAGRIEPLSCRSPKMHHLTRTCHRHIIVRLSFSSSRPADWDVVDSCYIHTTLLPQAPHHGSQPVTACSGPSQANPLYKKGF